MDFPLILCPDELKKTDDHKRLEELCYEASVAKKIKSNTVRDRLTNLVRSALYNVRYTPEMGHIPGDVKPFEGLPVFLVAAGPSLDKNGSLLRRCREFGPVVCVNTSVKPAAHYLKGGQIDALVTIEALDITEHLTGYEDRISWAIVDTTANPLSFEFAKRCRGQVLFSPLHALTNKMNYCLNLPSTAYGASVTTAAHTLAINWGAKALVVIGLDCAYTDDGRMYASMTDFEGERWALDGPDILSRGRRQPYTRVKAWDGESTVIAPSDLSLFRRWFEGAAGWRDKNMPDLKLYNCTEGGAYIEGFEHLRLTDVLKKFARRRANGPPAKGLAKSQKVDRALCQDLLCRIVEDIDRALSRDLPYDMLMEISETPIVREYVEIQYIPQKSEEGTTDIVDDGGGPRKREIGSPWFDFTERVRGVLEDARDIALDSLRVVSG